MRLMRLVREGALRLGAWNALLIALVLAAAALGWWRLSPSPDEDAHAGPDPHGAAVAEEVLEVAEADVVGLLSFDPAHVERQLETATARLTGAFREEYARMADRVIVPAARRHGITTRAAVVGRGLVDVTEDEAQVLLFVNQRTTSDTQPKPRIDGSRLRISLELVDGEWRVAGLDPV